MIRRFWPVLLLAAPAAFCADPGIKPRPSLADYPASARSGDVAIGAALLTPEEVRAEFASDLNPAYLVVEVSVYPSNGRSLDIASADFLLRIAGGESGIRAADPRAMAADLQKNVPTDRNVDIYPQVGIGYGTGRYGGGLSTSTGVGVGVGSTRPAATEKDRKTMQLELTDKALPEGQVPKPVAGYLYFPASTQKRTVAYQLQYHAPGGDVLLTFYPPARKRR